MSFMIRFFDFLISGMSFLRFLTLGVIGQTGDKGGTGSIGSGGGGDIRSPLSFVSLSIDSTGH